MLYHYTDRISLAEIRRDGVILARKQTLYKDMFGQVPWGEVGPLVWLTENPYLDGTIVGKLSLAGWPAGLVGDLCRIVLPDGYAGDVGLVEYTRRKGYPDEWWEWVVRSASLIGSHYAHWRVAAHDIPSYDWLGCEVLSGWTEGEAPEPIWRSHA